MDDIVREVLSSIDTSDESIEATWISRADEKLINISQLVALFNGRDYSEMLDNLDNNSNTDAQTLVDAVTYLSNLESRGTNLLELDLAELDTLCGIAKESFGTYTNIVRDFINLTYDISIKWPISEIIPRSSFESNNHTQTNASIDNYIVVPNPSNGHFRIESSKIANPTIKVDVFDSVGKLIYSGVKFRNEEISLKNWESGIYFVRVKDVFSNDTEMHKVILN
jgi:hypothetical protein